MRSKKSITIFIISLAAILTWPGNAQASSLSLSLSPSLLEANIKPGKTITAAFTFSNTSDSETTFVARIIPFVPADNQGNPTLKPNQQPEWLKYFSLSNTDIRLNEPFTLSANQTTQLILTISIPNRAISSDLYATLLVSSVVKDKPVVNSNLGAAIGSNLILTISPLSHPPALVKITDFSPTKNSFLFRYADFYITDNLSPIFFSATAKNIGKYFTKNSGSLTVSQNDSNISTQILLPNNILSNSERTLEGSPSGELVFRPNWTNIGSYLVSLNLRSENSSSHGEVTLLILPIKLGLILIIALIVLYLIGKLTRQKKHAN